MSILYTQCTPHVRSVVACTQHAVFSPRVCEYEFELTHELLSSLLTSRTPSRALLSTRTMEVVGQYRTNVNLMTKFNPLRVGIRASVFTILRFTVYIMLCITVVLLAKG